MNIIDVYEAHETVDEYGRLGASVGIYSSKSLAEAAAREIGWYGGAGRVFHRKAILDEAGQIYILEGDGNPRSLLDQEAVSDLRTKALAKLTAEERKALGV